MRVQLSATQKPMSVIEYLSYVQADGFVMSLVCSIFGYWFVTCM